MSYSKWRQIGWALGVTAAFGGCGGGGGSTITTPPSCDAGTKTCYVRASSGSDTNSGADADNALQTIGKAASLAHSGYKIIVGPGTYREGVTTSSVGLAPQGLQFIGDVTGAQTGDAAGPVMLVSPGSPATAGFNLFSSAGSSIDGFTITGFADAGIVIKSGSDNFTIQDCIVFANPGDGIRVQDSANVLIFNNLVYNNQGDGFVIAGQGSGSANANLINNTVVSNTARGLQVGNSTTASPQAFLRNNIFEDNGADATIKVFTPPPASVPRSDLGYDADFNLVRPATYQPTNIKGNHDIAANPLFTDAACPASVLAAACAYHLQSSSPAIDQGDSLNSMSNLREQLRNLTTTGTTCDQGALDLGFHYPTPSGRCT
jgi:parallel beta-helix repeat protein